MMKNSHQNEEKETRIKLLFFQLIKSFAFGLAFDIGSGAIANVTGAFQSISSVPAKEIILMGAIIYFFFSTGVRNPKEPLNND